MDLAVVFSYQINLDRGFFFLKAMNADPCLFDRVEYLECWNLFQAASVRFLGTAL